MFKNLSTFENIVNEALGDFGLESETSVNFSNLDGTDLQINSLVQFKKHKSFDEINVKVINKFLQLDEVETCEVAPQGFININLSDVFFKENLYIDRESLKKTLITNQDKIILDYGGANIGKTLHVGHIRTLNIGRALNNIYKLSGSDTLTDIHFGDWGMPIGLIIAYIDKNKIKFEELIAADLEIIYPEAARLAKENDEFYDKAKYISKELNNHNDEYIEKWKIIYDISTQNIKKLLHDLGFEFDLYKGESNVVQLIPDFIEKLKSKELISLDEGAYIASDNQDPPAIVVKSDGSYVYLTTDLATVIDREKQYSADEYIYVVDQRQKKHFEQLFQLIKFFSLSNKKFTHIGFGTINDRSGKPLKTREGGNYKLEDLYQDIKDKLYEKNRDTENLDILAKSVLTYSDLMTNRLSDYKFDIDKFTNINGKSAIYIQYSNVRAKKLIDNYKDTPTVGDFSSMDRHLAMEIIKFRYYFDLSLEHHEPHHLAEYAYKLCQEFNSFYKANKIFSEDNTSSEISHFMYVVIAFHETLLTIFECLNLQPVENM